MWDVLSAVNGGNGPWLLAEVTDSGGGWINVGLLLQHLVAALVFSVLGVVVFVLAIGMLSRMLPFSLRKELEEDQNVAIGIIIGCVFLGIAIIIAAAMIG